MASLMENLIVILDETYEAYEQLLALSLKKTPVIVSENLEELARITDEEQLVVSRINSLDKKRDEVMKDMAVVLNKDVANFKLKKLIQMMAKRPEEQRALAESYDKLERTAKQVARVNEQNRELIQSALEMVQFNMNILHSAQSAPESANYNKGAYSAGVALGTDRQTFDAKQ